MNHALSKTDIKQEPSPPPLFICSEEKSGKWIACDKFNCPIEWYHWQCVSITKAPPSDWICPLCSGDEEATVGKKALPKSRISQRLARIVYETTEASIFENIIAESQAMALEGKDDATGMQEAVGSSDSEEQQEMSEEENSKEKESEERLEETLAQKMRSRREGALKEVEGELMLHSYEVITKTELTESIGGAMEGYDTAWRRVNAGIFSISAERSTIQRFGE